jgi:hypothetical protein
MDTAKGPNNSWQRKMARGNQSKGMKPHGNVDMGLLAERSSTKGRKSPSEAITDPWKHESSGKNSPSSMRTGNPDSSENDNNGYSVFSTPLDKHSHPLTQDSFGIHTSSLLHGDSDNDNDDDDTKGGVLRSSSVLEEQPSSANSEPENDESDIQQLEEDTVDEDQEDHEQVDEDEEEEDEETEHHGSHTEPEEKDLHDDGDYPDPEMDPTRMDDRYMDADKEYGESSLRTNEEYSSSGCGSGEVQREDEDTDELIDADSDHHESYGNTKALRSNQDHTYTGHVLDESNVFEDDGEQEDGDDEMDDDEEDSDYPIAMGTSSDGGKGNSKGKKKYSPSTIVIVAVVVVVVAAAVWGGYYWYRSKNQSENQASPGQTSSTATQQTTQSGTTTAGGFHTDFFRA